MRVAITALVLSSCTFEGGSSVPPSIDAAENADAMVAIDAATQLGPWRNVRRLSELEVFGTGGYDDPMLTDDSEIFFCGPRMNGPGQDLYSARRADDDMSFLPPTPIAGLNTMASESTLWVSPDGLTLLFGRDVGGGSADLDVFIATRVNRATPFNVATSISETPEFLINSPFDEGPGALSADGLSLYISSNRDGQFDLWVATRPTASDPFDAIEKLAVSEDERDEFTPKLSADEKTLHYSVRKPPPEPSPVDVVIATRASLETNFGDEMLVEEIDVLETNVDFAPAPNGLRAVFASLRDETNERIYIVERSATGGR